MNQTTPRTTTQWNKKTILFLTFIPLLSLISFLIFIFLLNEGSISRNSYWQIQLEYFIPLNHFLSSYPQLWNNLTHIGDALVLFPLLSFFLIIRPQVWVALFATIPLGLLLSQGGKKLAEMPRPASVLNDGQLIIIGDTVSAHTSLPSGHTITIFAAITVILGVLIPKPQNKIHIILLVFGLFIAATLALSRVAVGAHWPLDIITGSIFGYFAGISGILITHRYKNCWQWLQKPNKQFIVGGIMLTWSFYLMYRALYLSHDFLIVLWISALIGTVVSLYLITRRFASHSH
jgi:membrane-associated phospholipid phosphatase